MQLDNFYYEPVLPALFFMECKCTDDWQMRKEKFGEQVIEISELRTVETEEENDGIICDICHQQKWVILPANHEVVVQKRLLNTLEKEVVE